MSIITLIYHVTWYGTCDYASPNWGYLGPTNQFTDTSNEAIPLATLIITILIFKSLYYGINQHCFCTNEQSYDKLLSVHIIPLNRWKYNTIWYIAWYGAPRYVAPNCGYQHNSGLLHYLAQSFTSLHKCMSLYFLAFSIVLPNTEFIINL